MAAGDGIDDGDGCESSSVVIREEGGTITTGIEEESSLTIFRSCGPVATK